MILKALIRFLGEATSIVFPKRILQSIRSIHSVFYTGYYSTSFKQFGKNSYITPSFRKLSGGGYISVGNGSYIGKLVQLTAYDTYDDASFSPAIIIGDNSSIGDYSHITAINLIHIGNNVRMGKNILITDNAHGVSSREVIDVAPNKRTMFSKGPVIIEDNVWIGEKCSILPNVTIGYGSIIGAGAVVAKSVPPYSVVGGNPARVIKTII